MIKINLPIFIPEDAKYIKRIASVLDEESLLTYEDKVKRNPLLREVFRMESFAANERPVEKTEKRRSIEIKGVKKEEKGFSGKLEYIKNLTDNTLLLYVADDSVANKSGRGIKGTPLHKYTKKNSLTKKQQESDELKVFYEDELIQDITKAQYEEELRTLYHGTDPLKPIAINGGAGARSVQRDEGDRKERQFVTSSDGTVAQTEDLDLNSLGFSSEEENLLDQFGFK